MGRDAERGSGARGGGERATGRKMSYDELARMGDGRTISEVLDELEAKYGKGSWLPPWLRAEGGRAEGGR